MISSGAWLYSTIHKCPCKVIEEQTLWGQSVCRVWLPGRDEDHVAFRYAYESKFRSCWDRGEQTDLVVVLRSGEGDLGSLASSIPTRVSILLAWLCIGDEFLRRGIELIPTGIWL